MVPFAQFPNASEFGLRLAVRVTATEFAVIVTGELVTAVVPGSLVTVAVPVAVVGVPGAVHCTRIVHDEPALKVVPQFGGRPVNDPLVTRVKPVLRVTASPVTLKVLPLLLETTKSRVVVLPTTTSVNRSGAGFTTTSVLLLAIWNSTAPTSAGFVEFLGRGLPKKSVAGAPALAPRLTAADVPAIEYAPPVAATDAEATISSGAVGVVALGRLRVKGP